MTDNFKAFFKNLLSYTKSTWDLDDYPLRYKKQTETHGQYNIGELKPWVVQVINWWTMTGLGETKAEAYQMLKTHFDSYRKDNEMPRPGAAVPLQFADTSEMDHLEGVAVDFFKKILELDYYDCFISDESYLMNFEVDEKETLNKINSVYKLDLPDLGDGNIVRLLTLIKDKEGNR